jgi:hypothetical protein
MRFAFICCQNAYRRIKSRATWKIWGDTVATLDMGAAPRNLPARLTTAWPGAGYAGFDASFEIHCYNCRDV